jgi:hypothetical protein
MSQAYYYLPSFLGFFFHLLFVKIILAKFYNNNLAKLIKITPKTNIFNVFPISILILCFQIQNHAKMRKITTTKCGCSSLVPVH